MPGSEAAFREGLTNEATHGNVGGEPSPRCTLDDVMKKLCSNGVEVSNLRRTVEDFQAALFEVQKGNDALRREVEEMREREERTMEQLREARHLAEVADGRAEELSAYLRRNNLRVYGIPENEGDTPETTQQLEDQVLSLLNNKMKQKVSREDIEAVHRVGQRRPTAASANLSANKV
ncbi:hypothetical protein ACOMHN_039687 [Nucella lapillus]